MQNLNATDLASTEFARRLASAETDFDKRAAVAQSMHGTDAAAFATDAELDGMFIGLARYELDLMLRIIARLDEQVTEQRETIQRLETADSQRRADLEERLIAQGSPAARR